MRVGHQADGRLRRGRLRRDARQLARRFLAGLRLGRERGIQLDERPDDARIERLPAFLMEQADRGIEAHRLVIRPFRHQGVKIVDHRKDPRAERDLVALEAAGVSLTVPPFVMAQDQRGHRIGKRHAADDFRADLRVDADLLELLLRERTRLGQDVLGHRQLADVVKQRRGFHALDFGLGHAERPGEAGRVDLDAADMALGRLILGVDRQRQRFDGGEMQIGDLLHVPLLILDAAHVNLVGPVNQIDRGRR